MIYFTMKKFNENRAFLAMLCFLLVFSCKNKDNGFGFGFGNRDGDGDGNGDVTKVTLTITKPTNGKLVSKPGNIDCGSKDTVCKAEFSKDSKVTLTAKTDKGYTPTAWQGACDKTKATERVCKLVMDADKTAGLMFGIDTDGDGVLNVDDVDDDNNGLIEVHNLDMFNHIQYNLTGTSYKTGADAEDNRKGAPKAETDNCTVATMDGGKEVYLCGYELTKDLDFAEGASYADGTVNTGWRPEDSDTSSATNEGFSGANNFAGIFEGNEHSISNLYSRGDGHRGLFRSTTSAASIRNLGVVDANLYVSDSSANSRAGGLVGQNLGSIMSSYVRGGTVNRSHNNDVQIGGLAGLNLGNIRDSYATGDVNGNTGSDYVGGLIGWNGGGSITACYATGAVNGGTRTNYVGGLVGYIFGSSSITASYATGAVNGGDDGSHVGGLVGIMFSGTNSITASYATGTVNGSGGVDNIGGLVGHMRGGTNSITASYATGAANGGAGDDRVGGLVGFMNLGTNTTILASYATGAVNGDAGNDNVGGLIGLAGSALVGVNNSITTSYATGAANGGTGDDRVGGLMGFMSSGTNTITACYATSTPDGGDPTGSDPAGTDTVGALVGEVTADGMDTTNAITHSYAFGTPANDDTTGNAGTAHPTGLSGSGAAKANTLTDPTGTETTDADDVWDDAGRPRMPGTLATIAKPLL